MLAREEFNALIQRADFASVLCLFDEDPSQVRRLLTRLTYLRGTLLHENAIKAFKMLSTERAEANRKFFEETIRRHLWGMNEEGSNIDWSAPEIIGAIIAGRPDLYKQFLSLMFYNALLEPIFHESLQAALEIVAQAAPELAAPYQKEFSHCFASPW